MEKIIFLHNQAMDLAEKAFLLKKEGDEVQALEQNRKALDLEKEAALLLRDEITIEPTRSVLFRSAATLAYECNEYREAEKLISYGLSGNPPQEIIEELRNLMEQVNFLRHLSLRNVVLNKNEMQVSLHGPETGSGSTSSNAFISRISDLERLIYRTVERLRKQPFRESRPTSSSLRNAFDIYLSVPRGGSFTITVQVGKQLMLPGLDDSDQVIDEIMECLTLINSKNEFELKNRINDESYYKNFIGLAKRIAPDGTKINLVGLTSIRSGNEKQLPFTRKRSDFSIVKSDTDKNGDNKTITVQGVLLFADNTQRNGKIKIRTIDHKEFDIIVPTGMMADIVRPLWENEVVIVGQKKKNSIILQDISKAE